MYQSKSDYDIRECQNGGRCKEIYFCELDGKKVCVTKQNVTLTTECLKFRDISTVGELGLFQDQDQCGGHPGTWLKFAYYQNRFVIIVSPIC